MLRFFIFLSLFTSLFASTVDRHKWENGESYLLFLQRNNLPTKPLYYNLDRDDRQLTEEMRSGIHYQILRDTKGNIEQILLPLNNELQIHIAQKGNSYSFEVIPIISTTKTEGFYTTITSSPNYNILKATGSNKLVQIFVSSFRHSLNFKNNIRRGDKLAMIYTQKYRLGYPYSMPILKVAMIEMHHKKHYIYLNSNGRYYNEKGYEVEGFLFGRPIPGARVSSPFSKRRWHPILHKWKAHNGVDFAARRGTPVHAAGAGIVIWCARAGTYGNLVKIRHADGYETRYAHLHAFRRGIHRGSHVKKGQIIAYVGTTGRSTGPHLHFEIRIHGRPINPLHIIQIATKKLTGRKKRAFLKLKKSDNKSIALILQNKTTFKKLPPFQNISYVHLVKDKNGEN